MNRRDFLNLIASPIRLVTALMQPEPEPEEKRDVHTEHCCLAHGCKYGDENCTVTNKQKTQSYPCEWCDKGH